MPDRLYFTNSDEANELIATDPMALLIGFALDQQVTVNQAFLGPLRLQERFGSLDAGALAAADLQPAFREKPAIHRYPAEMAERVEALASTCATNIAAMHSVCGPMRRTPMRCARTSRRFPGFGEMKIKSLAAVLAKRYKLTTAKALVPAHPTLGDVDSPQALLDYQAAKKEHKAEWSKMRARSD